MHRSYFFAVIGVTFACLLFVTMSMWRQVSPAVAEVKVDAHPVAPYKASISALGITEPSSGNIFIGSPVTGVVQQVAVTVGTKVQKGDILFKLDDRSLQTDLFTQEIAYEVAMAQLKRLEALPQPQDLAIAQATASSARASLEQAKSQYEMVKGLQDSRAMSQEEINRRRFAFEQAQAKWQQAHADLQKVEAGAWHPDKTIVGLQALQAKANVAKAEDNIERTIIRSPIDGTVLQVKIHEGEDLPVNTLQSPIMIVGNIDPMYVRVSINQFDAPYFRPDARAVAFLQGDTRVQLPLEFVRLEPYLVSKQNLTNELTEKVDTRVLQAIYRITKSDPHIFVGQQLDVFIEANY